MRSFLLAPLFAATAVSALAIDMSGNSNSPAERAPVVGQRALSFGVTHKQRRAAASGHKRMIRRKMCKPKKTTSHSESFYKSDSGKSSDRKSKSSTHKWGESSTQQWGDSSSEEWRQPSTSQSWGESSTQQWGESSTTQRWGENTWAPEPTDGGDSSSWDASATSTSTHGQSTDTWAPPASETGSSEWSSTESSWATPTDGNTWAPSSSAEDAQIWGPSSTTTTSTPPEATGGSSGGGFKGDGALFPVSASQFWTTAPGMGGAIPMLDALKVQAGKLPPLGNAPDGSQSLICNYKANQVGGSQGFSFYTAGDNNGVDITKANDVLFSYAIMFADDFDWVKGGKLPGLYGGNNFADAKSCSGGRKSDTCFSTRLMWRAGGAGEIYNYLPPAAHNSYCQNGAICNPSFGDSIGRGSWNFPKGQWVAVAQRVRLNDPGQANGYQEVWINGQSVLRVDNLTIRMQGDVTFQGIMSQTFFGGGDLSYAPQKEEKAYFKDWTLAIVG